MDCEITEKDFWQMTIGEVERAIESYRRRETEKLKMKAYFDYTQADLIGRSIGRLYSSSTRIPPIYEVYTSLFKTEELQEVEQKRKDELSVIRFKEFAESFNQNFKTEVSEGE